LIILKRPLTFQGGRKRSDLDKDLTFNLALTRLVEVIGEAADRIPRSFQEKHPEIEWSQIIGMRNRLIHGYDEVDFDILWNVVNQDIPALRTKLEELI